MILFIDTTQNNLIEIGIKDKAKFVARKKFKSDRTQAEKLLPAIEKLLKAARLKLSGLKGIAVANQGGSFTSLRIGVVTANALGYALKIATRGTGSRVKPGMTEVVAPIYERDPEITVKKERSN